MPFYLEYRDYNFHARSEHVIDQANQILAEMRAQGYTLTLRQLYYQFVRRNWIENKEAAYKKLGRLVTQARESGRMDWEAIEDRGRRCTEPYSYEDPHSALAQLPDQIVVDRWAQQATYLEVWVEKQALESVIARPCERLQAPFMACKGYLSASEAWRAGRRFRAQARAHGKRCVLIHLADHDPSGLNMTADNRERVRLFAESEDIDVRRIALNMDQVEEYRPPPNPAKETDSRFSDYSDRYGENSWELDALEPAMLDRLISATIEEYIDPDLWAEAEQRELELRQLLEKLVHRWDDVQALLDDMED